MDQKEIHELIKLVSKSDISELKLKDKDFSIVIRTKNYNGKTEATYIPMAQPTPVVQAQSVAPQTVATTEAAPKTEASSPAATDESKYVTFKSPMVGTFYRKPSPDKDVFVKVGDSVSTGDILCIIEAMKLFNEIENEINGTIVKVLADDMSPVEYDQPLFLIDPA
jgi:acetyl-CoA carboxylase biotin carboxyl carrier protein